MNLPFNLLILKTFCAQRNRVRKVMADLGLSPGQPKILQFLWLRGECLQKDLAAQCEIEPPTISRLLEALETRQWILRRVPESDRRAVLVALTAEGRKLVEEELLPRFSEINALSLRGLSLEERRFFCRCLQQMYNNLTGVALPDGAEESGNE